MEILVIWLAFSILTTMVATQRGLSGCLWCFAGLMFGPFALLAAFVVSPGEDRMCPFCKGTVGKGATKCRNCGSDLPKKRTSS